MSTGLTTALRRKTGVGWRVVWPFMAAVIIAGYALFSMFTPVGAWDNRVLHEGQGKAGNPSCTDLGYDNEYKIDRAPMEGEHNTSKGTVEITSASGDSIDWESDFGIDAVIVKAGAGPSGGGAYEYQYDPEAFGDEGLVAPGDHGISHVSFCWDRDPGQIIVTKDATPDDSPWTFHFDGAVDGEILHGQQLASDPLDPGTYTVNEDLDELIGDTSGEVAWDLVDIECVSEDGNSTYTTDLTAGSAEIDLGEGDTVTCTFFNEAQPPVVIPEVPAAILFPIIMLGLGGGAYLIHRRRSDAGQMA